MTLLEQGGGGRNLEGGGHNLGGGGHNLGGGGHNLGRVTTVLFWENSL